jgi:putative ABC transport system permease protein
VEGVAAAGPIAFSNAVISSPTLPNGELLRVAIVGVEPGQPGEPAALTGRQLTGNNAAEAILDRSVILRLGLDVGDTLTLRTTQGTQDEFYDVRVVGLSDGQQYGLQPSVFLPILTWDRVRPKSEGEFARGDVVVNIVAVKLAEGVEAAALAERLNRRVGNIEVADLRTTYEALPGYSAQQSTLDTQRYFTLLIGVLVIGGFFQIQMLQKVPQIGVLKAIGASNLAVALAAILQITVVTALGVAIGALSSLLLSLALPPTIPFVFTGQAALAAIVSLLLIGPLGGIVSIRYAVRIEPLKALGLSA